MQSAKEKSFFVFCINSTFLALLPGLTLYFAAAHTLIYFFGSIERFLPKEQEINTSYSFVAIIFSPIIETFLLIGLIHILKAIDKNWKFVCIYSGIIFGILHGLSGFLWFFSPCWAFMVFAYCYLYWIKRNSKLSYWAACIPHMLNNAIIIGMYYLP